MGRTSPTFPALSRPRLLFGGEYRLVVGNAGIALVMAVAFWLWYWLVLALALHIFFVQVSKREPEIRKIYAAYSKQGDRYEPWVSCDPIRGERPLILVKSKGVLL